MTTTTRLFWLRRRRGDRIGWWTRFELHLSDDPEKPDYFVALCTSSIGRVDTLRIPRTLAEDLAKQDPDAWVLRTYDGGQ